MLQSCIDLSKEATISGRYLPPESVNNWLENLPANSTVLELGKSVLGKSIYAVEIGSGSTKILGWSQMHGNESTTTKAIIDLINLLTEVPTAAEMVDEVLKKYRLHLVLQLNPDGSAAYTRENANNIDLNRDAQDLTQPESRILLQYYKQVKPDLCLNLHDQRSIYGFTHGKPAALSFLAPAADEECSITPARRTAIKHIDRMIAGLGHMLPGMIGRYDDSFNPNCVGDSFQKLGTPTILFEAGHMADDYSRELAREHVFKALLLLLGFPPDHSIPVSYDLLPENKKNYFDLIFRNGVFNGSGQVQDLAVQYDECLDAGEIVLVPIICKLGVDKSYFGHKEVDLEGAEILVNSYENVFENEKLLTIAEKYPPNREFFANM